MTEDEAKAKWCPFARSRDLGCEATVNRPFGGELKGSIADDECACLASACMAWRVLTRTEVRHRDGHVVQPGEIYLRGHATPHQVSDGGYCGLAGAPQ